MRILLAPLGLIVFTTALSAQSPSKPVFDKKTHVNVSLVPEGTKVEPGKPFRIGLRFELEEGWHTYWRNAGDAGLPPTLTLSLPEGFTAGEIEWPYPDLFGDAPEMSYGYHHLVVLPVTITPPATLAAGGTVSITAKASWLVCNEVCIPGKADLALEIPVGLGEQSAWAQEFRASDSRMARMPGKMTFNATRLDGYYELRVANAPGREGSLPKEVHFFAADDAVIDHSAAQSVAHDGSSLTIRFPISAYETAPPDRLRGIVVAQEGWNGGLLKAITVDAVVERKQ